MPDQTGLGVTVSLQANGLTHQFASRPRAWQYEPGTFGSYFNQPAAATSAWAADDTFVIKQCFTETPYHVTHQLRFEGDQVFYDAQRNVGFGGTKQAQLTGRAK